MPLTACLWIGASPLGAQTRADTVRLSLGDAQALALRANPELLAARRDIPVAGGELRQARVYSFNPEIELEGHDAGSRGGVGEYEARFVQEIEWAGQRGLRIGAAEAGLRRAEASVRDVTRLVLGEVTRSFYEAFAARRRLELAEATLSLNERLLEAVRVQLREGEISLLEANLAEVESARARAAVLQASRESAGAALQLGRLLGFEPARVLLVDPQVPAPPSPAGLEPDSLVRIALARRADLQARSQAVRELETLGRLARREAVPNLRVGALAEREERDEEPSFGLGISLPIPLWNRNQGLVAQRDAQADQARLERDALELRIRAEVAQAYRGYLAASEEARVFEEDVLDPARQNQTLLDTAYREGKLDLAAVLLLRNQLLEAERGYWDAWLAQRQTLVDLLTATATLPLPREDTRTAAEVTR